MVMEMAVHLVSVITIQMATGGPNPSDPPDDSEIPLTPKFDGVEMFSGAEAVKAGRASFGPNSTRLLCRLGCTGGNPMP